MSMILPNATLGILGGGQLGRMFVIAARTMGYRVVVLDPDPNSPAAQLADEHVCAAYDDPTALAYLGQHCRAITTEFENVPAATLAELADKTTVHPRAACVAIAQDRAAEKNFFAEHGFAVAPFSIIAQPSDCPQAAQSVGFPAILKVARLGYDGKGQIHVNSLVQLEQAFAQLGEVVCVLEQRLTLRTELSVVVARTVQGETAAFSVAENVHEQGILAISTVPAQVDDALRQQATRTALAVANTLDYVGVMAVEFFVVGEQLLINEMAPRPHNSGHYTLDACVTDQFEQQVRAICNLPLGDTRLLTPVAMLNLLGDVWHECPQAAWEHVLKHPNVKLHLYGKHTARKGRKMGHCNCLSTEVTQARALAQEISYTLAQAPKQGVPAL